MINNTIELAKRQLEVHAQMGEKSTLSIFEVARLMDTVSEMSCVKSSKLNNDSIFFGFSVN